MEFNSTEELASALLHAYEEDLGKPFPYQGARKLRQEGGEVYEGFIPDLNMYFYNIASHCGGVKKILKWPKEKLQEAQEKLNQSFFDRHARYKPLEPLVTGANPPDLYACLMQHERMRIGLLKLLSRLLSE